MVYYAVQKKAKDGCKHYIEFNGDQKQLRAALNKIKLAPLMQVMTDKEFDALNNSTIGIAFENLSLDTISKEDLL